MDDDNIKAEFTDFYNKRLKEKHSLYTSVSQLGFFVIFPGAVLVGIGALFDMYSVFWGICYIFGNFSKVMGLLICSIVPVDEFDCVEMFCTNWKMRYLLVSFAWIYAILGGYASYEDCFERNAYSLAFVIFADCAAIFLISCVLLFSSIYLYQRIVIVVCVNLALLCIYIGLNAMLAFSPGGNGYSLVYGPIQYVATFLICGLLFNDFYHGKVSSSTCHMRSFMCEGRIMHNIEWSDESKRGFGANTIYRGVLIQFLTTAVGYFANGIAALPNKSHFLFWAFAAFSDYVPVIIIFFLGSTKTFTLLARIFEGNVKRRQHDGAVMASLIAKCKAHDSISKVTWIPRGKEMITLHSKDPNEVNRANWMKATFTKRFVQTLDFQTACSSDCTMTESSEEIECIKVAYDDDVGNRKWFFSKDCLNEVQVDKKVDVVPFNKWVEDNFDTDILNLIEINPGQCEKDAYVLLTFKSPSKPKLSLQEMEVAARNTLRVLEWRYFDDEVFTKSPRDLKTEEDKKKSYDKSKPFFVEGTLFYKKIDFFISHSWSNDADAVIQKCVLLRNFSEMFFKKHLRYPTFWLDKVCMDQRDTSAAVDLLPINIGACNRVLVLMSKEYLKRLWCVWELFTLFTFNNKEALATERIEIINLDGSNLAEELKNFSIDEAHCYGPVEEFKLRRVIYNIGVDKLYRAFKGLSKVLENHSDVKKKMSPGYRDNKILCTLENP